ncbi:Tetracyclin repressor, C-terminal all-alpha domain [Asanoa hainanensis]|uniref:Tetracyclin repressor, C-terminal all-alpha domain n=1 Tax=Asanoa hainanensis TaxID=560556 RepID=A0A239JL11_9ACTN|nr:TetR/AcrR family transcriptional regulator [Asanoa hainanensis]SNT06571.1 Tetracyclin repressor, C-terminal all-alpha domain [Asanoa hainanensis]
MTAAIALADAEGLPAVSMRAVASALDTTAGSLYRYLSSRDDLLDLMTDHAVGELKPYPRPAGDWLDQLQALATQQLELHRRHRWLGEVIQRPTAAGPQTLSWFDHCLGILREVPAPTTAKFEAIALMTGTVVLFSRAQPTGQPFAALDPARHPHLTAALANPGPPPKDDLFARALRALLTGLLLGERGQEAVAEGVHAPDRAVGHRGQAG